MDVHHINPVSDLADPVLAYSAAVGLAPVGAAVCAAVGLIATCQHGAADKPMDVQRKRPALQSMLVRTGFGLHPTAAGIYIVAHLHGVLLHGFCRQVQKALEARHG